MNRNTAEAYFEVVGPPSSPLKIIRLAIRRMKQRTDVIRYIITEKPTSPAGI